MVNNILLTRIVNTRGFFVFAEFFLNLNIKYEKYKNIKDKKINTNLAIIFSENNPIKKNKDETTATGL